MPVIPARPFLSLGEIADLLSVQSWRICALFELGLLQEPERVSGRRMIPKEQIPEVIDALRSKGWLKHEVISEPNSHPQDATNGH